MKKAIGAAVLTAALTLTTTPALADGPPACGTNGTYAQLVKEQRDCRVTPEQENVSGWFIDALRYVVRAATHLAEVAEARGQRIARMKEIIASKNGLIEDLRAELRAR